MRLLAFFDLHRDTAAASAIVAAGLEAMITIARHGSTARSRPQQAIAVTMLFVVNVPLT